MTNPLSFFNFFITQESSFIFNFNFFSSLYCRLCSRCRSYNKFWVILTLLSLFIVHFRASESVTATLALFFCNDFGKNFQNLRQMLIFFSKQNYMPAYLFFTPVFKNQQMSLTYFLIFSYLYFQFFININQCFSFPILEIFFQWAYCIIIKSTKQQVQKPSQL